MVPVLLLRRALQELLLLDDQRGGPPRPPASMSSRRRRSPPPAALRWTLISTWTCAGGGLHRLRNSRALRSIGRPSPVLARLAVDRLLRSHHLRDRGRSLAATGKMVRPPKRLVTWPSIRLRYALEQAHHRRGGPSGVGWAIVPISPRLNGREPRGCATFTVMHDRDLTGRSSLGARDLVLRP